MTLKDPTSISNPAGLIFYEYKIIEDCGGKIVFSIALFLSFWVMASKQKCTDVRVIVFNMWYRCFATTVTFFVYYYSHTFMAPNLM